MKLSELQRKILAVIMCMFMLTTSILPTRVLAEETVETQQQDEETTVEETQVLQEEQVPVEEQPETVVEQEEVQVEQSKDVDYVTAQVNDEKLEAVHVSGSSSLYSADAVKQLSDYYELSLEDLDDISNHLFVEYGEAEALDDKQLEKDGKKIEGLKL